MAYFGRLVQKPLQKPGSGTGNQRRVGRVARAVENILDRDRAARLERGGHEVRANRADRAGRKAR